MTKMGEKWYKTGDLSHQKHQKCVMYKFPVAGRQRFPKLTPPLALKKKAQYLKVMTSFGGIIVFKLIIFTYMYYIYEKIKYQNEDKKYNTDNSLFFFRILYIIFYFSHATRVVQL